MTEQAVATQPAPPSQERRIARSSGAMKYVFIFILLVTIPTAFAAYYYLAVAADRYVTSVTFSVRSDTPSPAGMIAQAGYSLMNDNSKQDLLIVKEFIESPALLNVLQEELDLKSIYQHENADFLTRMPDEVTNEMFLEHYRGMINNELNQDAGIINLSTQAFTPEDAIKIAEVTLDVTEQFINSITSRIRSDDLRFAEDQLKDAEGRVVSILEELNRFRKDNNSLDPTQSGTGVLALIGQLESEKAMVSAELQASSKVFGSHTTAIKNLKRRIAALQIEIDKQKDTLVEETGDTPLSDVMQEYQKLLMRQEFSLKRYEIALTSYEAALVSANRKTKYIVRIVEPALADAPELPHRQKGILVWMLMSAIGAVTLGLFGASIRDHVVT